MSVLDHEELAVNVLARNASDSIAAVPIKKRRLIFARSSSPPLRLQDCDIPQNKPFISELHSSASNFGAQLSVGTAIAIEGSCWEPKGESIVKRDFNEVARCESLLESNSGEFGFQNTPNFSKDSTLVNKPAIQPVMENAKVLSASNRSCELPLGEGHDEEELVPSDEPAFETVSATPKLQFSSKSLFGLCSNDQSTEGSSLKQEKMYYCSSDLPLVPGSTCRDSERKVDSAHLYVNRPSLDINIAMDMWDDYLSDTDMKQSGHERIELGDLHKKKSESHPSPILVREFNGSGVTLGKYMLQKCDYSLRFPNLSASTDRHYDSEVSLDLQLKPPGRPEPQFSWIDSSTEMADLSLSLAGNLKKTVTWTAVKSEPYEEEFRKDSREVEFGIQKLTGLIHVNAEPCEVYVQNVGSKTTGSSNLRSDCSKAIKLEPLEDRTQKHSNGLEANSPHVGLRDLNLTCNAEVSQDSSGSKVLDLNSEFAIDLNFESVDSDGSMLPDGVQMPISASIPLEVSKIKDEAPDLASQARIPDSTKPQHHSEVPKSSSFPKDAKGIVRKVRKVSKLVSESLEFGQKELNSAKDAIGTDGLASDLHLDSMVSDGIVPTAADGMSENITRMVVSDGEDFNSSKIVAADEICTESYGNYEVAESGEKIEVSAEILEERSCDDVSDSSHHVVDARDTVLEQMDDDDEYEDGEFRGLAVLNDAGEGSAERREERKLHGKEATNFIPVNAPTMLPSHGYVKVRHIQNPDECIDKRESGGTTPENLQPSALGVTAASKKRLINATRIAKQHYETTLGLIKDIAGATEKGGHGEVSRREENAWGMDSAANGDASKHENLRVTHSRVIKLKTGPYRSSHKKPKPNHALSMMSHNERDRFTDKSFRHDKQHSRWHRNDSRNDRFRKSETERSQVQQFGRRRSDFTWVRSDGNRSEALHCDQNIGHESGSEQVNDSIDFQFARPENAPVGAFAVALDNSIGGGGRQVRKPTQDEILHLSHLSSRRQAHGAREGQIPAGSQVSNHPVRHISPNSRCIGRDVPDFLSQQARNEKLMMREFPDGMVDHPPFSHPHQQNERAEKTQRERSLSPIQRGPVHLPPVFFKSPPRSLERSPCQWSTRRRSPDVFDAHPEVIHRKSPPITRHGRMQSPHQRPYFSQDMMVRRCGSIPDDVRDINPTREHFPRHGRGLQRNIHQGFDIDPREAHEEECFRPFHYNQSDHAVDADRRCDERHGAARPFKQQHYGDQLSVPFGIEDGPPRPIRFCPEVGEEFLDRGSPRDFDGHIRSRLGDTLSRARGMKEQEENYRYHGRKGWHDAGFSGARVKRRRY